MFYRTYKEAHENLAIPGSWQKGTQGTAAEGISSIKITSNPRSLDKISPDMSTIYYVGIGKKSSQGEPADHQTREDQAPFFTSKQKQNLIPVLIKLQSGVIYFAGHYKVSKIYKRISPDAKRYYEIQFSRVETL
jgi:hypothetical protein